MLNYKNLIRLMTPLVLVSQLATPVFSAAVVYAETTEPVVETERDVDPVDGEEHPNQINIIDLITIYTCETIGELYPQNRFVVEGRLVSKTPIDDSFINM